MYTSHPLETFLLAFCLPLFMATYGCREHRFADSKSSGTTSNARVANAPSLCARGPRTCVVDSTDSWASADIRTSSTTELRFHADSAVLDPATGKRTTHLIITPPALLTHVEAGYDAGSHEIVSHIRYPDAEGDSMRVRDFITVGDVYTQYSGTGAQMPESPVPHDPLTDLSLTSTSPYEAILGLGGPCMNSVQDCQTEPSTGITTDGSPAEIIHRFERYVGSGASVHMLRNGHVVVRRTLSGTSGAAAGSGAGVPTVTDELRPEQGRWIRSSSTLEVVESTGMHTTTLTQYTNVRWHDDPSRDSARAARRASRKESFRGLRPR